VKKSDSRRAIVLLRHQLARYELLMQSIAGRFPQAHNLKRPGRQSASPRVDTTIITVQVDIMTSL
jgi:hypothetical protein